MNRDGTIDPSRTCVCLGGELNPCAGCGGRTINLHNDEGSYVPLDGCPYHGGRWEQERYLLEWFSNYRNGHLVQPLDEWPTWVSTGVAHLSQIVNAEERMKADVSK